MNIILSLRINRNSKQTKKKRQMKNSKGDIAYKVNDLDGIY